MDDLRNERVSQALDRAVATGEAAPFFELLRRGSGLPGPRPNLDLARAVGYALARHEARADRIVAELDRSTEEYLRVVAAMALAARAMPASGARPKKPSAARVAEALAGLQALCEDPRHLVRLGVIEALRMWIASVGEAAVAALSAWTDGYLQAHVALSALADRPLLDALPRSDEVLARLEEAFVLADASPRSAKRTQGMRTLRGALPAQIVVFAARFPETVVWLSQKAASTRPETREVVAGAVAALRRTVLSDVEASRLSASLEASGKPPRDPSRVVQGTRRRGRRGRA
jgi:hypothetical protein